MATLDWAAVEARDPTGQVREALDLAAHLRDAVWRVESAQIAPVDAPLGLIAAGMGGSAVGGRLAAGVLAPLLRRPVAIADGYELPGYAGPGTLVLCSSYSGATEETSVTVGTDVITLETPKGCVSGKTLVARLSVRSKKRKGHVVIECGSRDDLQRVCQGLLRRTEGPDGLEPDAFPPIAPASPSEPFSTPEDPFAEGAEF